MLDQIRAEPGGSEKLRKRSKMPYKRLAEELIPLARYVRIRYREDRCIKVRWQSGSQPYDAILISSGALVDRGLVQKEVVVEITTSVHENEHLVRELLNAGRPAFGVKKTFRDRETGIVSSSPYPETSEELESYLAQQIIARIKNKATKSYPNNTLLIVDCVPNGVTEQGEWDNVVARVAEANEHKVFSEVFLTYSWAPYYSATLYSAREGRKRTISVTP